MTRARQPHRLEPLVVEPTEIQLFRFSAVTWNPHRVHYDARHAAREGYEGVLVHSHLRAALALRCLTEGLGDELFVTRFSYRVERPALAGETLVYQAEPVEVDGTATTHWRVWEEQDDGGVGLEGTAAATTRTEAVDGLQSDG